MGKDLKGRELGSGIAQRKSDKRYIVSFVKSDGIRIHRSFASLKEAKQWKADITYEDAHQMSVVSDAMTVNAWYASWSKQKEGLVRPNTVRNYRDRYERNIKPMIGRMRMSPNLSYRSSISSLTFSMTSDMCRS